MEFLDGSSTESEITEKERISKSHPTFSKPRHHPWLAFCGGVLCQMLPFLWWQSGVVQLTTLFGVVWTIHSLLDVFEYSVENSVPALASEAPADVASQDGHGKLRVPTVALCNGLKLGCSFCVTYLLCNYWGMFLTLILVPSSLWLWNASLFRLRFWLAIVVAAGVSVVVLGPLVYVQKSLASQHQWTRDLDWIRSLSAHPRDYLDTPRTTTFRRSLPMLNNPQSDISEKEPGAAGTKQLSPIPWSYVPQWDAPEEPPPGAPEEKREDRWTLGSGTVKLVLAPVGLMAALLGRRKRWGLFAVTFGLIAFGISLGPTRWFLSWVPVVGGMCPYEWLQQYVPGFALIRSPFRFAMFVQLAIAWLAIEFLDLFNPLRWRHARTAPDPATAISDAGQTRAASTATNPPALHPALLLPRPTLIPPVIIQWCQWCPLVLASLAVIMEVWPPRPSIVECPSTTTVPAWVHWLRENSAPGDAVVCLPFPTGYSVLDYQETCGWMYWGTLHGRPLVNGYSGFFPKSFVDLKDKLAQFHFTEGETNVVPQLKRYPWDSPGLKELNSFPVRFVIVKRSFATRNDVWQHPLTKFRWAWVTSDEQFQLDVYEMIPMPSDEEEMDDSPPRPSKREEST